MYRSSSRSPSPQTSSRRPYFSSKLRRQKTTDLFPEETSAPLLPDSAVDSADSDTATEDDDRPINKMGQRRFFDNLRGWDRPKVYRYIILLALSLSGDGW